MGALISPGATAMGGFTLSDGYMHLLETPGFGAKLADWTAVFNNVTSVDADDRDKTVRLPLKVHVTDPFQARQHFRRDGNSMVWRNGSSIYQVSAQTSFLNSTAMMRSSRIKLMSRLLQTVFTVYRTWPYWPQRSDISCPILTICSDYLMNAADASHEALVLGRISQYDYAAGMSSACTNLSHAV